jgi:hypothetical protein
MTDTAETIRVEIVAAAAQFRSELDTAIKKLVGPGGLKDALRDVPKEISVRVDIDTGAAKLTLDNFDARVKLLKDNVKRGWAVGDIDGVNKSVAELNRIERAARDARAAARDVGAGGSGGGGVGGLLNTIGGAGPAAGAGAGALAVAGVAGPPILGAGALAGGGLATVALGGLLPLMTLVRPALGDIAKLSAAYTELRSAQEQYGKNQPAIEKAQNAYNAAVAAFGPASAAALAAHGRLVLAEHARANTAPQIVAAQARLNKLMQESSPEALKLAKSMSAVDSALNDAGLKIVPQLAKVLTPLLNTFTAMLPTLVRMAQIDLSGIARGLAPLLKMMESAQFKALLVQLAQQFAALMPIMLKGLGDLLLAFMHLGVAAGPAMLKLAEAFTHVLDGMAKFTATPEFAKDVNELIKAFVAWVNAIAPLVPSLLKLMVILAPISAALAVVFRELIVTDNIGKGFHATVKALGDVLYWLGGVVLAPLELGLKGVKLALGGVKLAAQGLSEVWKAVWGAVQVAFNAALNVLLGGISTLLGALADVLRVADKADFLGVFGNKFRDAAKSVEGAQQSVDAFRKGLTPAVADSQSKAGEIASAHQAASKKIVESWGTALGATKKGIGEVNAAMLAELKSLNGGKVVPLSQGGPPLAPGLVALNKAGGGFVGRQGERGHDDVPLLVGRGEAVLHGGHQAIVNQSLARTGWKGGLGEVFSKTSGLHYNMAAGGFAGGGTGAMGAMVNEANQITSRHFPYAWGGGHSGFAGPYDCSGAVSAVLHAGGFLSAPEVSGEFESYGLPGPGAVTLYANPTHVYMSLDGHFFGTSASNPGGGAGWFSGAPRSGFAVRHVDPKGNTGGIGAASGGAGHIGPFKSGMTGAIGSVAQGAIDRATSAANAILSRMGGVPGGGGGAFGGPGQPNELVTASEFGGHNDPSAFGHPTASGAIANDSLWGFAELSEPPGSLNFSALGGLPMGSKIKVGYGGRTITVPKVDVGAGGPGIGGHIRAIDLSYAANQALGAPGLEDVSWARAAAGRLPKRPAAATKGKPPRKALQGQHPGTKRPPAHKQPKAPKARPLKVGGLLPSDIVAANVGIHSDEVGVANLGVAYKHLLDAQALVPTEALATLTDADVAFLDPGGHVDAAGNFIPGPLGYEAGDELVNAHGMTTGRFFGPGGIAGGKFIAGIDTRTGQISALESLLGRQDAAEGREEATEGRLVPKEQKAIVQRKTREARLRKFLTTNVARAAKVKEQVEALTTGNLKANLAAALSHSAIASRKGELSTHLRALHSELSAESLHQAGLSPLEKEPGYAASVKAQITGVSAALAAEGELSSRSGSSKAIAHAREAILKNSLGKQLRDLTGENVVLGGTGETVGEGGLIGKLGKQVVALRADQTTHNEHLGTIPGLRYELQQELGALAREQSALNAASPVQVRAKPAALQPGGAETNAQLLALVKQQLETTQRALATSQAQFSVFAGFEPLMAGRLVGTFAQGVDRVARTGPAMVHAGEVILPDPSGPFGNAAVAQARGGQPVEVVIVMANNEEPLMKIINAEIRGKSLRVVTDHAGQRSRLMAGVTR